METWSRILTEYARDRIVSYRGTIVFDYRRLRRPKVFRDALRHLYMLECNARQTASTYPLAVSAQLEGRGLDSWAMLMLNGVRTNARSLGEVLMKLGDIAFDTNLGVLPFNTRLMTLSRPHCGLIVVGKDFTEAGKMLNAAKRRLAA